MPAADATATNFSIAPAATSDPSRARRRQLTCELARTRRLSRRGSADDGDIERCRGRIPIAICPHVDEGLALSRAGVINADTGAVSYWRNARNRSGRHEHPASRRELRSPGYGVLGACDRCVGCAAAAEDMPGLTDARPVPDRSTERATVKLRGGDRTVAQLFRADAACGKAERGVGGAAERYEQSNQSDGVLADESEDLNHWTGVSLLGARGASAWAEAAVLSESRLASVRRTAGCRRSGRAGRGLRA